MGTRLGRTFLAFVMAAVLFSTTSQAADVTVKLAVSPSGDHVYIRMSDLMAKEVEKRVPGRVDWQLFSGHQLGDDPTVLTGLRTGTHVATIQSSSVAVVEPAFTAFEAPFLFSNRDEVKRAIAAVADDLDQRLASKGLVLLGIGELGFRQITNNVRPIFTPTDLNGIKLRTPGNPFRVKMFQTLGANPTPMSSSELYVSLRQGVVDGQENPLQSIWAYKYYEVQKYISMSNHVFTPSMILFSKMHWDSWPDDVKEAIRDAAALAIELSFNYGLEQDQSLEARIMAENPDVEFNEVDVAAFKTASESLYDDVEAEVGAEFWTKLTNAIR